MKERRQESIVRVAGWPWRGFEKVPANAYTSLMAEALEANGVAVVEFKLSRALRAPYEVLHVHWPEKVAEPPVSVRSSLRAIWATAALLYIRHVRRRPVVWTVHNLAPHAGANPLLLRAIRWALARSVSGAAFLTVAGRASAIAVMPWIEKVPYVITPHGFYGISRLAPIVADKEPRGDLAQICFVGAVAPYKGVLQLVDAFGEVSRPDARLYIGGACSDEGYAEALRARARTDTRIELELRRLDDFEVAKVLSHSALAAYPYRAVFNSGSVMLAIECGVPALVPESATMREVASIHKVMGWTFFEGGLTRSALESALDTALEASSNEAGADATDYWDVSAKALSRLYAQLLR